MGVSYGGLRKPFGKPRGLMDEFLADTANQYTAVASRRASMAWDFRGRGLRREGGPLPHLFLCACRIVGGITSTISARFGPRNCHPS